MPYVTPRPGGVVTHASVPRPGRHGFLATMVATRDVVTSVVSKTCQLGKHVLPTVDKKEICCILTLDTTRIMEPESNYTLFIS